MYQINVLSVEPNPPPPKRISPVLNWPKKYAPAPANVAAATRVGTLEVDGLEAKNTNTGMGQRLNFSFIDPLSLFHCFLLSFFSPFLHISLSPLSFSLFICIIITYMNNVFHWKRKTVIKEKKPHTHCRAARPTESIVTDTDTIVCDWGDGDWCCDSEVVYQTEAIGVGGTHSGGAGAPNRGNGTWGSPKTCPNDRKSWKLKIIVINLAISSAC